MKKRSMYAALAVFLLSPVMALAQGTNSGATVTAPFLAIPPTIDGAVSAGEWDDAVQAAAGASEFLGSGPAAVDGQGNPFTFAGATDYLAIYIDPTNYQDDQPNSS